MRPSAWLVLPTLLALGCAPVGPATPAAGPAAAQAPAAAPAAERPPGATLIMGRVMAPAGIVAAGGGNIVAAGAGNMVAAGAGNIVAAGGLNMVARSTRGLLALSQSGLADTEVFLADAAGEPYPGLLPARTNRDGLYQFPAVPKGYTYMVVARCKTAAGKDARLQTLAKAGELGATANLDVGSTLVTAAMVDGASGDLGLLDVDKLKRAVALATEHLSPDRVPDLADPTAVRAAMRRLEGEVAELRADLADLRKTVGQLQSSVSELDGKISAIAKQVPVVSPLLPDSQALATAKLPIVVSGDVEVTLHLRALEGAPPLPADIELRVSLVTPEYPPAYPEQRVAGGRTGSYTVKLGLDKRQTIVYTVALYDEALGQTPIVADLYVDPDGSVDIDNERYIPYTLSLSASATAAASP